MSETLPALEAPNPHPIQLVVTDDLGRNRLTVLLRLILAIPHLVWISLWSFAVGLAVLVAWVVAIFAGRVPAMLHEFMATYMRYHTQLYAYLWIAADPYPLSRTSDMIEIASATNSFGACSENNFGARSSANSCGVMV